MDADAEAVAAAVLESPVLGPVDSVADVSTPTIAPGTVRDLVPSRLALSDTPGEALEPEEEPREQFEPAVGKELAEMRTKLTAAIAERDSARANERELLARVSSLERELRQERNKAAQAERQLQTIKATNAQLMRLRQGEQTPPASAPQQPSASRQGQAAPQPPHQPQLQARNVRSGNARGTSGAAPNNSGRNVSGAHQQAQAQPREGGGRQQPQPAKAPGGRGVPSDGRPAPPPAPQRGGAPAVPADLQQDPTVAVRSELRQALVAGDGQRLQMAVEQAQGLGLEAEAAHGRKKLEALLKQ